MIAVIFELKPRDGQADAYFDVAGNLAPLLEDIDGFLSVERFESLKVPGKYLSLSFWRDETAVAAWRNLEAHRTGQARGRAEIFRDYRLRVAHVVRDYGLTARDEAPKDSRAIHAARPR